MQPQRVDVFKLVVECMFRLLTLFLAFVKLTSSVVAGKGFTAGGGLTNSVVVMSFGQVQQKVKTKFKKATPAPIWSDHYELYEWQRTLYWSNDHKNGMALNEWFLYFRLFLRVVFGSLCLVSFVCASVVIRFVILFAIFIHECFSLFSFFLLSFAHLQSADELVQQQQQRQRQRRHVAEYSLPGEEDCHWADQARLIRSRQATPGMP
jgi:hypothetical protein